MNLFFRNTFFLHFNCTHEANTINIHMNYYTMEFIIRYVYKAYTLIILLIMMIAFIKKVLLCVMKIYYWTPEFPLKIKGGTLQGHV